jgi:hypothetical protein
MKYSHILQQELNELVMMYSELSYINDELWAYHPSNKNFINPIKAFDDNLVEMAKIERKMNELEREIRDNQ